jgi:hypothetical protein
MERSSIAFEMQPQPTETTCGPTCLHAVYGYYGLDMDLDRVIREVPIVHGGGTYGVHLAMHALEQGFAVRIYTYNLQVFDPTWFVKPGIDLRERLALRGDYVKSPDLKHACAVYAEFLRKGGEIVWQDLTPSLMRQYISRQVPILTGLSATYLYQSAREFGFSGDYDDIRGEPTGHFVVLTGYDSVEKNVLIADPFMPNPVATTQQYAVNIDRVTCSILLGVLTYDANLVVIQPKSNSPGADGSGDHAQRSAPDAGRRR